MTDAPKLLPDQAWLCNDRFWHIAGEHEFAGSTLYVRADTRPAVTLAEALAVPEIAALMQAAEDAYVKNPCGPCSEGTQTRDCALCAALDQIKRAT